MASFPLSIDNFTNPSATTDTASVSHAGQHSEINDAVEALEAKVGANSSAVTSSLDYKLTNTSSSNPGHKHTLAQGATDVTASKDELNVLDGIPATLTATEIGYLDGVTSAIQTQINTKAPTADPTFTGTVTSPKVQGSSSAATFPQVVGVKVHGASGAAETVNFADGDRHYLTLDENITITFSNPAEGQTVTLYMLQDGTGTNSITFADTITWADNTTPTWTTTSGKMNIAVISYIGGSYYGVGNKFA